MSYILEALKKAEKQRELGQVPGIGSVHEAGSRRPGPRWQWVLAVVLILNAAIIGALFWPAEDPVDTAVPSDIAPSAPVVPQPSGTLSGRPEPTRVPPSEAATVSKGEPSTPRPIADTHSLPLSSENPGVEARPLKPLPLPLPQEPPRVSQPARPEQQIPVPIPSPASRPAPAPKPQQLPVWPLVEDELFHQINNDLKVNVHVYNKIPEKRFVFMNMKIYHEGDQLLEGPQLEEITQDGVVLSFRGERFRVPAR